MLEKGHLGEYMTDKGRKNLKLTVVIAVALLCTALLFVAGYVIYIFASFYRLEDTLVVVPSANQDDSLEIGKEYSALTYNIGFGAYDQDFDFFMDTGYDEKGKEISGTHARAVSKENVLKNTNGAIQTAKEQNADFVLLQEVDIDSDRSYHIDQRSLITDAFSGYGSCFANNYHSSWLFYPFNDPIGQSNSGILSLSKYKIDSCVRRSLPLSDSTFDNLFDLDRCITISRLPIANSNKQFVLINVHMSAYDKGGVVRKQQAEFLSEILAAEYQAGNYVLVGGDFNHILTGDKNSFVKDGGEISPDWVAVWDVDIPGYTVRGGTEYDGAEMGSCRNNTRPYDKDWTYTCSVDGFLTSDNIAVSKVVNLTSHEFKYSDHNPVKITFSI